MKYEKKLRTDNKFSLLRPQLQIIAKQNNLRLSLSSGFKKAVSILIKSINNN